MLVKREKGIGKFQKITLFGAEYFCQEVAITLTQPLFS